MSHDIHSCNCAKHCAIRIRDLGVRIGSVTILVGIVCATHRGSFADQALTVLMTTLNGIPVFWIGLLLIYLFGVKLQVLPFVAQVTGERTHWPSIY